VTEVAERSAIPQRFAGTFELLVAVTTPLIQAGESRVTRSVDAAGA
jgi:hypothetical protein